MQHTNNIQMVTLTWLCYKSITWNYFSIVNYIWINKCRVHKHGPSTVSIADFSLSLDVELKYDIYINIQAVYSVLCWDAIGSNYSLKSSWVWCYKLGTPMFGEFPFFSADPLKLCQVRQLFWGFSRDVQSGSSPAFTKPFLHCLGCVLRSFSYWKVNLRPFTCHSGQRVQSWFHQIRESFFSCSGCPLGAFWQTPSRLSCAFHWGVASVWPLYHKGLISGVLQRWLSFWKVLSSPQSTEELWSYVSSILSGIAKGLTTYVNMICFLFVIHF